MNLRKMFGRPNRRQLEALRDKGENLFKSAMQAAARYDTATAIRLYTESLDAWPDPSPYINRGTLHAFRLRHLEALADFQEALRLDRRMRTGFAGTITPHLREAEMKTSLCRDGTRDKLIADLARIGPEAAAQRIWEVSSKSHPGLSEFHFFNELDNIRKFEEPSRYPRAAKLLERLPGDVIDSHIETCPDEDAYFALTFQLESFLCCYDPETMALLREHILDLLAASDGIARAIGASDPGTRRGKSGLVAPPTSAAGGVMVAGVPFDAPSGPDDVKAMADVLALRVQMQLRTEWDTWQYLMVEADLASAIDDLDKSVVRPMGLMPLEYDGEDAKYRQGSAVNPALEFIETQVLPDVASLLPQAVATRFRSYVMASFYLRNHEVLTPLRHKHALHFRNNCVAAGHFNFADRWDNVLDRIGAD